MSPLPREGRRWPELAQALRDLERDDSVNEARAVTSPSPARAVY